MSLPTLSWTFKISWKPSSLLLVFCKALGNMLTRLSNVQNINISLAIYPWLKCVSYSATCTAVLEKEAIKYIKKLEILPIKLSHQIYGPYLSTKKEKVEDLIK